LGGVLTQAGLGNPRNRRGKDYANAMAAELAAVPFPQGDPRHPRLAAAAVGLSDYRSRLEEASWWAVRRGNEVADVETQAKISLAQKKMDYAAKDIVFRSSRAMVSRQLAWVQLKENTRPNSPINFHERLERLRVLFGTVTRQLVTRVLALRRATKDLYQIDIRLDPPDRGHLLDTVGDWLMSVQERVEKKKQRQRYSAFTITLSSIAAKLHIDFRRLLHAQPFDMSFTLKDQDTLSIKGLTRGMAFEYLGRFKKPITLTVRTPPTVTQNLSGPVVQPDPFVVSRVLPVEFGLDIRPQHVDSTWNGDPYGAWQVICDHNFAHDGIDDVLMHLWMVHP